MFIVKEESGGVEVFPDGDLVAGRGVGAEVVPQPAVVMVTAHGRREERGDALDLCLDTRGLLNEVMESAHWERRREHNKRLVAICATFHKMFTTAVGGRACMALQEVLYTVARVSI